MVSRHLVIFFLCLAVGRRYIYSSVHLVFNKYKRLQTCNHSACPI